jgi:hypothetical protein
MKVENMKSNKGNKVANQFIITESFYYTNDEGQKKTGIRKHFQSYNSMIAKIEERGWKTQVFLDEEYWNYSVTTGKYRNEFLGEGIAATREKIASGEYQLVDLN